jgi:uncharacterized protein (UPF0216 family)
LNEFLKRYLDKDYNEGIHFTIIIESINKILAAAINVKNDIIVEAIKEYWKDEYLAYLSEQLLKMEKLLGV